MPDDATVKEARLFQSLSSLPRLRIISLLLATDKPVHIKGISRMLKMDYAVTYRHVENLRDVGLVSIYDVGRSRVPYVKDKEKVNSLIHAADRLL
jgi:ArsR family transcriptional regulator